MRRIKGTLAILMILVMVVAVAPLTADAAAKKPGKPKITKVTVAQNKVTVSYKKVKNAKSYKLYSVTYKKSWKYLKKIKASQKKKYSNTKKYKLKKSGKKYKVYQKKSIPQYKKLATSKKTAVSFKGSWGSSYTLAVRAYNGKKAGKYSSVKKVTIGKAPASEIKQPEYKQPDYNSYETYVFFGSDSRANDDSWKSQDGGRITTDNSGTEGTPRSDVIMLINVNRTNKTIDIVSVYRDTALNKDVDSSTCNFQKANKAYADYGPKEACRVLEKNFDIRIKGYAAANFKGVADVIDSMISDLPGVEGVTVSGLEVPTDEPHKYKGDNVIDVANMYLNEHNSIYQRNEPNIEQDGDTQALSGMQAVAYARVRYTEGWDMQRSVRQRTVLSQMIKLYNELSESDKISVIRNADIDTNLDKDSLSKLVKEVSGYTVRYSGFPFYKSTYNVMYVKETQEEKADYEGNQISAMYPPADFSHNVSRLHQKVYGESWYVTSPIINGYSQSLLKEAGDTYSFDKRNKTYDDKY